MLLGGRHILVLLLGLLLSVPGGYAILRGHPDIAIITGLGVILFFIVIRSDYRLPLILLCACLLAADSHIPFLKPLGLKLRWAVLGVLVLKEMLYWAEAKRLQLRMTGAHLLLLLFLALGLASSVYSVEWQLTFSRGMSLFLFFLVVFLYFWRQTETEEARLKLLRFLVKLVPLLYAAEVLYWTLQPGVHFAWEHGRLRCISGNPNGLGQLVMFTLPLLVWYVLSRQRPRLRLYLWSGILMGLALLFLSGSRASLFGLSLALLVLILRCAPRYFVLSLLALVLLHFVQAYGFSPQAMEQVFVPREERGLAERYLHLDLGGREEAWPVAIELGRKHLAWGNGFGTAEKSFGDFIASEEHLRRHQGAYPHNFLIHMFLDLGLTGAGLVLLLHLTLLGYALAVIRRSSLATEAGLPALAAALYLGGLANACFESWMFSAGSPTAFPFWFMTMLMIRYRFVLRPAPASAPRHYHGYTLGAPPPRPYP